MGSFINDVMQIWTFPDPPATLSNCFTYAFMPRLTNPRNPSSNCLTSFMNAPHNGGDSE